MDDARDKSIYEGLLTLIENEYPKTCPKCGRVYPNIAAFIEATTAVDDGSGLMGYETPPAGQQVAIFRNCACGSTIATFCSDRRDTSDKGAHRRNVFARLQADLQERGIAPPRAREELLAFIRGRPSGLLDSLGLTPP